MAQNEGGEGVPSLPADPREMKPHYFKFSKLASLRDVSESAGFVLVENLSFSTRDDATLMLHSIMRLGRVIICKLI